MGCRGQPSPRHHGQHEHRFPSVRPVLPGRGGASLESVSSENLNPHPSLPWLPGSPARDSWPSGGTGPFLCLSECTCHLHACALPSPTSHVVSTASPVTSQRAKLQLLPRQREATAGKSRRDGALETPKARSQPQTPGRWAAIHFRLGFTELAQVFFLPVRFDPRELSENPGEVHLKSESPGTKSCCSEKYLQGFPAPYPRCELSIL